MFPSHDRGAGKSNTAALAFGGETPPHTNATESWNGTNWTEVNNLNTARFYGGGAGTNTDAIVFGGRIDSPSTTYANTELWNGTNWTEQNDSATGRSELSGSGSSTSGLAFGGTPGGVALTEEWTGAGEPIGAWSTGGALNTARAKLAGSGLQTAALAFGGETPPNSALTESYDGSSWTEVNDLNTARHFLGGAGTQTSTLAFAICASSTYTFSTSIQIVNFRPVSSIPRFCLSLWRNTTSKS